MKKQFTFKLLSLVLILWISWSNIACSEAIFPLEDNALIAMSATNNSVGVLRKNCISNHGHEGILHCQKLVEETPLDPESWNSLGYKYYHLKEYNDALLAYKQALDLNSKYSLAWANTCGVLSQVKSYNLALKACDRALENDSSWGVDGKALAWDNKGNVLFYLGRYQQSLDAFDRALDANPNYHNANVNRSIVLEHLRYFNDQDDLILGSKV